MTDDTIRAAAENPMSLNMALDIAHHPGSYGRSMTAVALDRLAGEVARLRAVEQRLTEREREPYLTGDEREILHWIRHGTALDTTPTTGEQQEE
jgi:hypothetical protein